VVTHRYTLAQARSMLGVRGRRAARRIGHRAKKPSLLDLASLSGGFIAAVKASGGLEQMAKNPQGAANNLVHAYTGYNRSTGKWEWKYAWDNQWKPFAVIQLFQYGLSKTKVGKRLKKWKIPFLGISVTN